MAEAAIIVGGIVLAGAAATGAVKNLLRRRIPDLAQDDLLPDPTNDLKVIRNFTEQDKAGLKAAFGDSPDFIWILKDGAKLEKEDASDMESGTSYLMDFVFYLAENYGHIIKSVDKGGNFQGSIVLVPPVTPFHYKAYTFAAMAHCGKPPPALWGDANRKARFDAFADISGPHHEAMHDCLDDHWYLLNLGVSPSAQGKRVGTRLLKQAIHLAGDKPLFLECHNGNAPYYEKYGFQCKKNYPFAAPEGTSRSPFYYNAMRRDPDQ
eukprot:CAMPEP_0202443792 /NCGR_PEP_ID=MMETSP1360-20130828/2970_1 /ASSEMBLY_ACC=CAM_ASM_000848 /TAXON_ID=515479 /ORGANISM="Licmophora paradoxa, Strain CCMP2313" /LENGTH=264 /DNA_ID=CAMNT_0049059581 /DNA_START=145 /DNA_END=939 /DNA_ORIENTATION=+